MCSNFKLPLHYWPLITSFWFCLNFITSYAISVSNGHVYYFFPFISDTGAIPPESCVFGQMLNIGAALMAVTMYLRHKQISHAFDQGNLKISRKWHTFSFWIGGIACLGMDFVANFQETAFGFMHFLGAMMAFGLGSFYFIFQTRISFALLRDTKVNRRFVINKWILYTRVVTSFFMLPLFFAGMVTGKLALSKFTGEHMYYWTPDDGGFTERLYATFTEWIMAIFMLIYIATYYKDFKSIEYNGIIIDSKIK